MWTDWIHPLHTIAPVQTLEGHHELADDRAVGPDRDQVEALRAVGQHGLDPAQDAVGVERERLGLERHGDVAVAERHGVGRRGTGCRLASSAVPERSRVAEGRRVERAARTTGATGGRRATGVAAALVDVGHARRVLLGGGGAAVELGAGLVGALREDAEVERREGLGRVLGRLGVAVALAAGGGVGAAGRQAGVQLEAGLGAEVGAAGARRRGVDAAVEQALVDGLLLLRGRLGLAGGQVGEAADLAVERVAEGGDLVLRLGRRGAGLDALVEGGLARRRGAVGRDAGGDAEAGASPLSTTAVSSMTS
ncbi:MAG: hypothetical protein U1F43_25170 [Myxococcota bacterium]